jgi:hypothetical protein
MLVSYFMGTGILGALTMPFLAVRRTEYRGFIASVIFLSTYFF